MSSPLPTGDRMDLDNLPDYWQVLSGELRDVERLPPLNTHRLLSARAFDESQVAGPRTYMAVTRYLNVARDNHEALLALLEHRGATLWAPWSLLRPTFEAAFYATWILDPEQGKERRVRGLRCEVRDFRERRNHRAAFKILPELRDAIDEAERREGATSLRTYKDEAAKLGVDFDGVQQARSAEPPATPQSEAPVVRPSDGEASATGFPGSAWRPPCRTAWRRGLMG
ncbi:hypothetical protein [Cryptosporangium aurantiacum]|uniref:Uncharacterized protein n=1 Tax=Cryptosporangium aurantiacum TaxID=134849 RepID=A0A1M7RPX1_9ACTN|nr:hypothetical protein [Cryptosporangium aurantiacum]SHN48211.1 hypothetical protein SAMN05443668_1372 [Cryptosporangium aurantiacum]